MIKFAVLLFLLTLSTPMPTIAMEPEQYNDTREEWQSAHDILTSMMTDSPDVRADPMAHELLGDVYREASMTDQARLEYQIAHSLTEKQKKSKAADYAANPTYEQEHENLPIRKQLSKLFH